MLSDNVIKKCMNKFFIYRIYSPNNLSDIKNGIK